MALLVVVSATMFVGNKEADAATLVVTTTADIVNAGDGLTSLREAMVTASASPAADTIVLESAAYTLTDCVVDALVDSGVADLTLDGNGAVIHQSCTDAGVMAKSNAAGVLRLEDLTLTGGPNSGVAVPGAAVLSAGRIVLDTVTVTGINNPTFGTVIEFSNTAALYDAEVIDSSIVGNGGRGIDNTAIGGGVLVSGSTISDNTGGGVDLVDGTPLVVESSTVSDNGGYGLKTTGQGSSVLSVTASTVNGNLNTGIQCGACGTVTVASSTVSGNGVAAPIGGGGGIAVTTDQDSPADAPTIMVTNSTVSSNFAGHDGGGVSVNWIEAQAAEAAAQTTVSGSTIVNNTSECVLCDGGGISVEVGSLAVATTVVQGNVATRDGGGIAQNRRNGDTIVAPTSLSLTDSTVSGNSAGRAGGGASAHAANLVVQRANVSDNSATFGGGLALGGIFLSTAVQSGNAQISASTVSGNTATDDGGGLILRYPDGTNATITNSTVHANSAARGGGIFAGPFEPLRLVHATITANSSPIGANVAASSPTSLRAALIAEPLGGGLNCAPVPGFATNITQLGGSWFGDASCSAGPSDVPSGGNPGLGPLADNGGPNPTRLPATGSPIGGAVPAASCAAPVDQRGVARPGGVGCEPGAVEIIEVAAATNGTSRGDVLVGTNAPDTIRGLGGGDVLFGLGGNDVLDGGPGNDVLIGGAGDDVLRGGAGDDVLIAISGIDVLDGGPGADWCLVPGRLLPRSC